MPQNVECTTTNFISGGQISDTVVDDFLDPINYNVIKNTMLYAEFPWYYNNGIVDKGTDEETSNLDFQFTHRFYEGTIVSNYYEMLTPLLNMLEYKALIRVKANLTTITPEHYCTGMHTDQPFQCKTALYYVNTNNGWTEFENGAKIDSIANRLVIFDTLTNHTGYTCTDSSVRCLININYF
jgi:hypothetical protein